MRKILTILVGSFVLFVWNAISWMALPYHGDMLHTIPDTAIEQVLQNGLPKGSGIYHYPGLDDPEAEAKVMEGPRIPFMVYLAESTSMYDPVTFLKSFTFNILSAFLLLIILSKLADPSLSATLLTSSLCGLLAGFSSDFPQTVWYMFPYEHAIINTIDHIIAFGLAGIVMNKLTLNK